MKFSQCMIVKNEEENIERALTWGKGVVDEQIVVDTGSTDKTVEIAEKLGATVYHFEWINDFSAAKNFAVEKCSGDWIAFLDADEYLKADDAKRVRGMLETLGKCYNVVVTPLVDIMKDGTTLGVTHQARFFRNLPYLRYKEPIHEHLFSSDEKKPISAYEIKDRFNIYHTGYSCNLDGDEEKKAEKARRNGELLLKKIETEPNNPFNYFYLYDYYAINDDYEKAIECVLKSIELHTKQKQSEFPLEEAVQKGIRGYYELAARSGYSKYVDKFESFYAQAVAMFPNAPDLDLYRAIVLSESGKNAESIPYYESALKKAEKSQGNTGAVIAQIATVYYKLAVACYEAGQLQKFVNYAVLYIKSEKYGYESMLSYLITAFQNDGANSQAIYGFIANLYNMNEVKDFTFVLKAAKGAASPEFAQYLTDNMPQNIKNLLK